MGKIGIVAISHPDYDSSGDVERLTSEAVRMLKSKGMDVVNVGSVNSVKNASAYGKRLVFSDVDGVVLFLVSWLECSVAMAVYREIEHLPVCLWAIPMWEENGQEKSTGSYVSYTMFKGVLDRIGTPYTGALGPLPESVEDVTKFCRAAIAYQRLKRARIGLVGYTSMSIYTGTFDHVLLRSRIGPEVQQIDSYSLIMRAERQNRQAKDEVIRELREKACIHCSVTQEQLDKTAGLYLGLMELREELLLDAINVKCQYEFSKEYAMTMCVPLSLAADNGFLSSCEGDMPCTVSMMMLSYLTGQTVAYGDSITHNGNILKLSPCGFMPFSLGCGTREITGFMPGCGFNGIQSSFVMRPGRVTILRLIEDVGGYHLLIMTGEGLETKKRQGWMPALDVRLDGSVQDFLRHCSGQHYAICYGDCTDEIEMLARILRIGTVRI